MGWHHPDISLDELTNLIKGFIDILILASGYQSSGLPATWNADNIKKALQWGLFFEEVFKRLGDTVYFEDSVKELDASLLSLTSDDMFPQGLVNMTSTALSKARCLVVQRLIQTHPLEDAHLLSLISAIIETDINELAERYDDAPNIYINRLMSKMGSLDLGAGKDSMKDVTAKSFTGGSCRQPSESYVGSVGSIFVDHSLFAIQEILKRRASESCLSSVEIGLNDLLKIIARSSLLESERLPFSRISLEKEETASEILIWNKWKSRCHLYLLDKRTIRLLSGANLIFSAPKIQWIRMFEQLTVPTNADDATFLEIMEILLLGFISCKWSCLVDHFISHSCNLLPISKQYADLSQLLQGFSQSLLSRTEALSSKEEDILEYVMQLLKSQPHKLLQVPPVLAAAAIPTRSILFRMYFSDIEQQFNGASSLMRCCNCSQDGQIHRDCQLADRIRCLHVFHIQGSDVLLDGANL